MNNITPNMDMVEIGARLMRMFNYSVYAENVQRTINAANAEKPKPSKDVFATRLAEALGIMFDNYFGPEMYPIVNDEVINPAIPLEHFILYTMVK